MVSEEKVTNCLYSLSRSVEYVWWERARIVLV